MMAWRRRWLRPRVERRLELTAELIGKGRRFQLDHYLNGIAISCGLEVHVRPVVAIEPKPHLTEGIAQQSAADRDLYAHKVHLKGS
jgi:hypothetical protein